MVVYLRIKDAVEGVTDVSMPSSAGGMISSAAEDALPPIAARRPTDGCFVGRVEHYHLLVDHFDSEHIAATALAPLVGLGRGDGERD